MSSRNIGFNNYKAIVNRSDVVDVDELIAAATGGVSPDRIPQDSQPGVNLRQDGTFNPFDPTDGTPPRNTGTTDSLENILATQGAEGLLGLGGTRNNAYQLAANRADRRISANRKRVQDLVKLDPTNPLAALVTFLGAREEALTNADLEGIRNAYGRQERLTKGKKKFFEDLKKSGHENIFKELVNKRFGGDTDKAWMFLKDHPEVLAEEFNRPNPAKIKDYTSVLRTYQEIVKDMDFIGTGLMGKEAEEQLKTGMGIIKKWLDRQKALHDGQLPASEEKNLQKHMRKLEELRESVNSAKAEKIKSGNFTPKEAEDLKLELQRLINQAKANKEFGGTTPNKDIRRIAELQTALGIYDSKIKEKDNLMPKKKDSTLTRMEMENAKKELHKKWGYQGIETSFGVALPTDSPEWLNWSFDKQAEQINKVIDYWREKEKYSIQTDEKIPDWVSGLMKDKYPFTGEMLKAYLSKVDPSQPGVDDQIIADAREALNFKIPGVTDAQVSDDGSQVSDDGVTSVTRPTPEFYNTQDQEKFRDKQGEFTNPYDTLRFKDKTYLPNLDINTYLGKTKQPPPDSSWMGTDETANIFNDPEYGRTNKYVSPNASKNINNATIVLENVEKKVNEVTRSLKNYGGKSAEVIGDAVLGGSASVTKGTIKAVNRAKKEWDFIKRKTIKKKNELYKKLAQLNKEWQEANKLFGIELSPINIPREGLLGKSSKMAGEGRPLTAEESNRAMKFGWDRYDNEYTRTNKYIAPDASPLTPSEKKKQSISDKLNKKYNDTLKEIEAFVEETKSLIPPLPNPNTDDGFNAPDNRTIPSAAETEAMQQGTKGGGKSWWKDLFPFSSNNMIEEAPKDPPKKQWTAAQADAEQKKIGEERTGGMGGPNVFDPEGDGYDEKTARELERLMPLTMPKPTRKGSYDQETVANEDAFSAWVWHEDEGEWVKHGSSVDPRTGMILKGRGYKTYNLEEKASKDLGNVITKGKDGRYYSLTPDGKVYKGEEEWSFESMSPRLQFVAKVENAKLDPKAVGFKLKPKLDKDGKKVKKNGRVVMVHKLDKDENKIPVSYGLIQLTPKTAYATDYWKELVKEEKPTNEKEKINLLFNPKHNAAMSEEFMNTLEEKIRKVIEKENLPWSEEDIELASIAAYNWNGENMQGVISKAGKNSFKATLNQWDTINSSEFKKKKQVPDETWSQIRRYKAMRGWK